MCAMLLPRLEKPVIKFKLFNELRRLWAYVRVCPVVCELWLELYFKVYVFAAFL